MTIAESKMVNDYIRQNEERKAERNAIYNPTTGEGCLSCERLDFHVPDMRINHYQIPFDCFDEKIIRDLHEIGSVKAYLKALHLRYTKANAELVMQEYIKDNLDMWGGDASKIHTAQLGSVVGTHAGPGAVAVGYFVKK